MGVNHMPTPKKKKKVDYEALNSAFMRIPRMDPETARCFLDQGITQIYELQGRCADAMFEDARKKRDTLTQDRLYAMRMAVYYAEHEDPDKNLLYPEVWK